MRTILRPYSSYKDSRVSWLSDVPEHWEVVRNKTVCRLGTGHTPSRRVAEYWVNCEIPWFTLSDVHQIRGDKANYVYDTKEKISELGLANSAAVKLPRGTVILSRTASVGHSAILGCDMATSQDFMAWTPGVKVTSEYLLMVLRSMRPEYDRIMCGSTHNTIYMPTLHAFRMPLPPLVEQAAIVRFLDYADRRIRRLVQAKRHLVELLEEQKRTLVERLVTRGLDPHARLKSSGVNWLGDVPNHWTVASLRFRYDQCLGKMVDAKKVTGRHLVPYLRNVDVRWDSINTQDLPLIDIMPHELERFTVKVGDLLVCEGRHLGRCAFWEGQLEICGFQKALHRLRPLNPATDNPRFLFYCLYLAHIKDAFEASSTDNSIPHLTGEMLRAHKFPFPPLEEQTAITAYLDERFAVIKKAMTTVQAEILRVLEFRTRLIADVVTGKLNVREASEGLPSSTDPAVPDGDIFDLSTLDSEEAEGLEDDASELLPVAADED